MTTLDRVVRTVELKQRLPRRCHARYRETMRTGRDLRVPSSSWKLAQGLIHIEVECTLGNYVQANESAINCRWGLLQQRVRAFDQWTPNTARAVREIQGDSGSGVS